jgi:D-alanyl-D-alanine carboxypeptidase/D-alanyl-D-alanine-endopeptidase (penicillin-binding protein 4)
MSVKRSCLSFGLFLFISFPALWGQSNLTARLDLLIKNNLPSGSEIGISIYDLTEQRSLYAYRADKLSRPASTMKLLTGITTLAQPNWDDPFHTEVWYNGFIERDVLHGDIYVVGGFDPEFDDEAMDSLVNKVAAFPFSSIEGNVYGDVSMKDSLYWGNGWLWDDNPSSFQPYLSPLMYHKGMVKITATPGKRGEKAVLRCEPQSSFYALYNETQNYTPNAGKFLVSRNWLKNENKITVSGNVEHERTGEVNVYASQDFFMHTFVERLCEKGINIPDAYAYSEFVSDTTAVRMTSWDTPVQIAMSQLLKESDNLNAEAFLHRLSTQYTRKKRASANEGIQAVKHLIEQLGHSPDDYKLVDGSGLSNYNYISPELLVDLLKYAYSSTEIFQGLYKSLPIAGIDGTLKDRMKVGKAYKNVTAKTGTITGISCLAGYVQTSGNHILAFAIMNQNTLSASKARKLQDMICEELAKYSF